MAIVQHFTGADTMSCIMRAQVPNDTCKAIANCILL